MLIEKRGSGFMTTSPRQMSNNPKCYACGKSIKYGYDKFGYDSKTFKSYCLLPGNCNREKRPKNLDLVPMDYESVKEALEENQSESVAKTLIDMMGKSIAIRLSPTANMHLIKYAAEKDITSKNQAIVGIIEDHMKHYNFDDFNLDDFTWGAVGNNFYTNKKQKHQEQQESSPPSESTTNKDLDDDEDEVIEL